MAYRSSKRRKGKGRKSRPAARGGKTKTIGRSSTHRKGMYFQGGGKF